MKQVSIIIISIILFSGCNNNPEKPGAGTTETVPATAVINYSVTQYFAHDTSLFTEGFLFHNGQLFESSGSPSEIPQTKSVIGISDLKTGKFIPKIEIDKSKYFGEGIVFFNNKLYQLTYKNKTGFIYDANSLKKLRTFTFDKKIEGWGMTNDGKNIYQSDGTDLKSRC